MAENPNKDQLISALTEAGRQAQMGRTGTKPAGLWMRDKFNDLLYSSNRSITKKILPANRFPTDITKGNITNKLTARSIGRMFMFVYDPKTKQKLPYYDTFPLIIMIAPAEGGFIGLNLHYVFPLMRMKILEALLRNVNPKYLEDGFLERNVENKQIVKNYETLYGASRLPMLAPCFKRYLYSHVRSNFMHVDPTEWPKAILLPTESFKKASKFQVFAESSKAGTKKRKRAPVKEETTTARTASVAMARTTGDKR